jgi:hypothetical protein
VITRYGPQYPVLFAFAFGHVSLGVEPDADVASLVGRTSGFLASRA